MVNLCIDETDRSSRNTGHVPPKNVVERVGDHGPGTGALAQVLALGACFFCVNTT